MTIKKFVGEVLKLVPVCVSFSELEYMLFDTRGDYYMYKF